MMPKVEGFFDPQTSCISYVVYGNGTECAVIDPVLGFDRGTGIISAAPADALIKFMAHKQLVPEWILETHVHADHLSAACYLRAKAGGRIGIGQDVLRVQEYFAKVLGLAPDFFFGYSQFDHLFAPGETFSVGGMNAQAFHTPGHTPADVSYLIGDALFPGDTMFMPDVGTARSDFPGGDASALFNSIARLLSLPDETRMFVCHDYPPSGRSPAFQTTVATQRESNVHIVPYPSAGAFAAMRTRRDATLATPTLMWPSLQFNLGGGVLPPRGPEGESFYEVPFLASDELSMLKSSR
ncbi:MBL fold metallo-hydrolase [Caballeronia sp. dw_19]|uniref:MBL fold metallo-hydrolase n=1 Tax=Caballeronia sp. dw_19 TaxID=2719791 RepID=UPI001BD4F13E|nr:MBL fold metallo-hydrolase [Caballeronia sp. dw_19]